MHIHQYRLHPDWIARVEMFRKFASSTPPAATDQPASETPPPSTPTQRWPLPKLTYRHRSTFPRRPR